MYPVMLTIFILVCLVLMVIVLLQSSKGGGLAGAFGGGSSDTSVMGGRGAATLLGKLTVWLAVAFMALALILAVLSSRVTTDESGGEGIISQRQQEGTLDIFDVEAEQGGILDQIQTEGFEAGGEDAAASDEGDGAASEEQPAPAGN